MCLVLNMMTDYLAMKMWNFYATDTTDITLSCNGRWMKHTNTHTADHVHIGILSSDTMPVQISSFL